MSSLDSHSAVITGAGSGLGRALVKRFVREGAHVVAFDKSDEKLADLKSEFGEEIEIFAGDVRSAADNVGACEVAVKSFGKLDTFVGNSGLWDFSGALADTPIDRLDSAFDELFAVNVKGYILGAKAALPALQESRGSIVLTLSNAAFFPGGGGCLYVASKHAGVGLVRQLAYELAPSVRVNAVAPGGMATDLRGPASLGLSGAPIGDAFPIVDIMEKHSALRFAPSPEDYVAAYVLLASREDSSTVTGSVFDVSSFGIPVRPDGG